MKKELQMRIAVAKFMQDTLQVDIVRFNFALKANILF